MSKIATIPVFSSIVAILFFLNCQRWECIFFQHITVDVNKNSPKMKKNFPH